MTARSKELVRALERAARGESEASFDGALDDVLAQARTQANPDAELRALVARSLQQRLQPSMDGAGDGAESNLAGPARWRASGVRLSRGNAGRAARSLRGAGLLAAGVAIGFVWGRAPVGSPEPSEVPAVIEAAPAPAPSEAPPATIHADDDTEAASVASELARPIERAGPPLDPMLESSPTAAPASSKAARPKREGTPSAATSSLRFALEQLRKAQLFLRGGEPREAIGALDVLDARVPANVLQEEREVTRALALCELGEAAAAGALASRVLERAPDSAYAVSLRESCAGQAHLIEQMRERTSNPSR